MESRKIAGRKLIIFLLLVLSATAQADLPLTVEGLITSKGQLKLDLSLTYANRDRQGVATAEPITVQTGPTSFILLPTLIGETQGNSDTVVGTVGLRYGLTAKAEVYGRANYLYSSTRNRDPNGTHIDNESRFADAWFGLNYQFSPDAETPALLGFAELALHERHQESTASFKSWMVGATTYRAIDPIVFSFTAGYRADQSREDGNADYQPGDLLLLNPSVAFAVNDRVTLTTGLQWTRREADRLDGQVKGSRRTSTDLLLGVGYGIANGSILNVTFKANASGQDGADLRLNWLHTI